MSETRQALEAVLEPGERLLWSGAPDRDVMLRTLGRRSTSVVGPIIIVAIIAGIAWSQRDLMGSLSLGGLGMGPDAVLPIVAVLAVVALIIFLNRRQATSHVDHLAYGLSDRRLLIVHRGKILDARRPGDVTWVELQEREGAPGYSDIIWATRMARGGSSDSRPSAVERERARVGFKALRDGRSVFERIERWRADHRRDAEQRASATAASLTGDEPVARLAHPSLGFSIATPSGWHVQVRRKTFPFGKTRLDRFAHKWYEPGQDSEWNVVRLRDEAGAEVSLEVVRSDPAASFETMADPRLPGFVKAAIQVVDAQQDFQLGGVAGFRVDQKISGKGSSEMAIGETSDKTRFVVRMIVLHDGTFQYYLNASWPEGSDAQQAACEAILETFQPCARGA
jgi:hypothetical protein